MASGYAKRSSSGKAPELNEKSVPVSHLNIQSNTLNGENGFTFKTLFVV